MDKLEDNQINQVAGGKVTEETIKEKFDYKNVTCDECGKVLYESMSKKGRGEFLKYNYLRDYGLNPHNNLCQECHDKRLLQPLNNKK